MIGINNPYRVRTLCRAVALCGAALLAGCQSYRPAPLDLDEHRAQWPLRLTDDEPLRAFAHRLSEQAGGADTAFDLTDGIGVAEAEVVALFYNPELRQARLGAGVALATADTAGLWEDPVFGFDGAELLSPAGPFEFGLTLGLTLPVSGRLSVEKDRAGAAYAAELLRVVDAEWRLRGRVRWAWAAWSLAQQRLGLIDEADAQLSRIRVVSDVLEEAGELTRAEARLIRMQQVELGVQRLVAEQSLAEARLELMGLMGLQPGTAAELVPSMPTVDLPDASTHSDRLIRANTALAVARAEYRVAEEALRLEVRKQYPDIEIGGGYGSEGNDDRLLLGASLPLPVLNANRGGIAQAEAARTLARAQAQGEYERLAHELAQATASLDAAQRQLDTLTTRMVPMLEEQAQEIDRLAELGEVDALILLETVTRRYDTKVRILDLHLAGAQARIQTATLLGPDEVARPAPATTTTQDGQPTPDGGEPADGATR